MNTLISCFREKARKISTLLFGYFIDVWLEWLASLFCKDSSGSHIKIILKGEDIYFDNGRYIFSIVNALQGTDKQIYVTPVSILNYQKMGMHGRRVYKLDKVKIFNNLRMMDQCQGMLVAEKVIGKKEVINLKKYERIIFLNFDISTDKSSLKNKNWSFMPYPMYPSSYSFNHNAPCSLNPESSRRVRILFSGNTRESIYSGRGIWRKFNPGILSRAKIIAFINHEFRQHIFTVKSREDWEEILKEGEQPKIVIVDNEYFRIPSKEWRLSLSLSDFFVCPPGKDMPMCHNSIEAMSVGTIPLINYPDWFSPNLEAAESCIAFHDTDGLRLAVKSILEMNPEQIYQLRSNVIHYYKRNLDLEEFWHKALASPVQNLDVFINAGHQKYVRNINRNSIIWDYS